MVCTRSHVLHRGLSQGNVPSGCGTLAFRLCSVDGETRSRRFLGCLYDTNGKSKTLRKCSFDCRMGKESLNNSENTLPKIHKRLDIPPGRPIVSSNPCPTERISAYVDQHLKPLVSSLPLYIRDTKDLLSQLQALPPLPPGALLFTMDVTALYTNIPHEAGLAACAHVLDSRLPTTYH